MGKSLREMQEERDILFGKSQEQGEIRKIKLEKKSLAREILGLKHEKKIRFVKRIGRGAGWFGKKIGQGVVMAGEQYARAEESKRQPTRKVKRVKKVKKQNSQKRRPVRRIETYY